MPPEGTLKHVAIASSYMLWCGPSGNWWALCSHCHGLAQSGPFACRDDAEDRLREHLMINHPGKNRPGDEDQ